MLGMVLELMCVSKNLLFWGNPQKYQTLLPAKKKVSVRRSQLANLPLFGLC